LDSLPHGDGNVATSAPGDGLMISHPVVELDGALHLELGGAAVPLLMGGKPVSHFLPGWRASALYCGFAPLFLLELVHDTGQTATWFLDQRLERVGDRVDGLPAEILGLLRLKAAPLLARLVGGLLEAVEPELDGATEAFLRLGETTRREIALQCLDRLMCPPRVLLAAQLAPASLALHHPAHGLVRLRREAIEAGLATDWCDRLPAAFADAALIWPSPVDGAPLRAQGCLCLDDFHFAYRFADPRHGLVFFILVADHHARIAGMWLPALGLLVSRDGVARGVAGQLLPHLAHWVVTHTCQWAEPLFAYLRRGAHRFASVMRGRPGVHIGHQLWNELSGIDHLLSRADAPGPRALPEWIVLDASDGIELYGPVDELFPQLAGHVNRRLASIAQMIRYAYTEGVIVLRVTAEHVSARLRERILERVRSSRWAAEVDEMTRLAGEGSPVVLVGLRVENRTLVDLAGFLHRLVAHIAARAPRAVIVFDGHNARGDGGQVIESHGEQRAARSPAAVEQELVSDLRAAFAGQPVMLIDTIGRPLEASLAWAERACCFISIWGASLAKYRWVCNKPGLVISSRVNLLHRIDLHIYDDPRNMEAPTELRFINAGLVTDRPEAPLLVNVAPGNATFFNFDLDEPAVLTEATGLIARFAPGAASGSRT